MLLCQNERESQLQNVGFVVLGHGKTRAKNCAEKNQIFESKLNI